MSARQWDRDGYRNRLRAARDFTAVHRKGKPALAAFRCDAVEGVRTELDGQVELKWQLRNRRMYRNAEQQ